MTLIFIPFIDCDQVVKLRVIKDVCRASLLPPLSFFSTLKTCPCRLIPNRSADSFTHTHTNSDMRWLPKAATAEESDDRWFFFFFIYSFFCEHKCCCCVGQWGPFKNLSHANPFFCHHLFKKKENRRREPWVLHVIVVIFYFRSGIHRLPIPESQLQNHMPSVWPFPPPNYLLLTSNVLSGRSERNARLCGVIYLFSRPKITLINLLMQIVQHLNELFFFFFFSILLSEGMQIFFFFSFLPRH